MQAMKDWHKSHPHLFVKSPRNHTGRDNYLQLSKDGRAVRPGLRLQSLLVKTIRSNQMV